MASPGRSPAGGRGGGEPGPGGLHRGRHRAPVPLVVLVATAVGVLGLLLAPVLTGVIIGLLRLALVLIGFFLIALVGLYLWRRGDVGRFRR